MIEIKGKYNEARIFTDVVDSASIAQIQEQFHVSDERKAVEVERDLRKLGREPVWKDWDQSFDFKR